MGAALPMIAQVDPTSIAPYLAGPGAAVIVLMVVLYGLYVLVIKHVMPLASRLGDRHLAQIDKMIETQRDEGKAVSKALIAIEKSLGAVDRRLARLEGATDVGCPPNGGAQV
jgi:hypothetical protein